MNGIVKAISTNTIVKSKAKETYWQSTHSNAQIDAFESAIKFT